MKKVLIIAYYWPPSAGSGVQRWLKFVKYLRDFGWEPIVYTPENPDFDLKDPHLLSEIPENVLILKQPIFEPFKIYQKLVGQKADAQVNPVMKGGGKLSWKNRLALWIRANCFIPDSRMFWINPSIRFLTKWLKDNPVDALVSTGPPHSMHLIGLGVKKRTNIPWLADFRDPWTNIDFYHELNLEPWADARHHRLERKVVQTADHVVAVSQKSGSDYALLTQKPVTVITNGFDPADIDLSLPVNPDPGFIIIHIGMWGKARSHEVFWKGLAELRDEFPDLKKELVVRIFGVTDPFVHDQIKFIENTDWIEFFPYIPHNEVITEQRKATILLLSINRGPTAQGIIPGKLFEYLALAKPILCMGPIHGDSAIIVKQSGAGVVVDYDDLQGFKREILNLFELYKAGNLKVNSDGIKQYSRRKLCGEIAKILNEISEKQYIG